MALATYAAAGLSGFVVPSRRDEVKHASCKKDLTSVTFRLEAKTTPER
jgi:hypothetical protein